MGIVAIPAGFSRVQTIKHQPVGVVLSSPEVPLEETLAQAEALRKRLKINRGSHCLLFAVSLDADDEIIHTGPFCRNPKKSTGADDRLFKAQICLGLALGYNTADSLALGCGIAGFFARNARSANQGEIGTFPPTGGGGRPGLLLHDLLP